MERTFDRGPEPPELIEFGRGSPLVRQGGLLLPEETAGEIVRRLQLAFPDVPEDTLRRYKGKAESKAA